MSAKGQSGFMMMLKAMGIDIDPEAIKKEFNEVGAAVIEVRDRLRRIEEKLDKVLAADTDLPDKAPAPVLAVTSRQERANGTNRS